MRVWQSAGWDGPSQLLEARLVEQLMGGGHMAILREWRAEVRRERKDEYVDYVTATGLAEYRQTEGNLGAVVAVRDLDAGRSEIVTLSWWKDEASIKAFAGDDISHARYYPEDDQYLLTHPETVLHYDSSMPCESSEDERMLI